MLCNYGLPFTFPVTQYPHFLWQTSVSSTWFLKLVVGFVHSGCLFSETNVFFLTKLWKEWISWIITSSGALLLEIKSFYVFRETSEKLIWQIVSRYFFFPYSYPLSTFIYMYFCMCLWSHNAVKTWFICMYFHFRCYNLTKHSGLLYLEVMKYLIFNINTNFTI